MTLLQILDKPKNHSLGMFAPNSRVGFRLDSVMISALNFIREYQGNFYQEYYDRMEFTLNEAVKVTKGLIEEDMLKNFEDLTWNTIGLGDYERKEKYLPRYHADIYNEIHKEYPSYNHNEIVQLVLSNYVQTFIDNLKGNYNSGIFFKYIDLAISDAIRFNKQQLLQVLIPIKKNPEQILEFKCCGQNFDNTIFAVHTITKTGKAI